MSEMIACGVGQTPVNARFNDEDEDPPIKALTRDEAQALRARNPPLSPWRVVGAQVAVGGVVAALVWLVSGQPEAVWSALYGAAAAVVHGGGANGLTEWKTSDGTTLKELDERA